MSCPCGYTETDCSKGCVMESGEMPRVAYDNIKAGESMSANKVLTARAFALVDKENNIVSVRRYKGALPVLANTTVAEGLFVSGHNDADIIAGLSLLAKSREVCEWSQRSEWSEGSRFLRWETTCRLQAPDGEEQGMNYCCECGRRVEVKEQGMKNPKAKPREKTPTCSFCGCGGDKYRVFISAPKNVYICHECVALCVEIITTEHAKISAMQPKGVPPPMTNHIPPCPVYSLEKHGSGFVIYAGRNNESHGLNLGYIQEPDKRVQQVIDDAKLGHALRAHDIHTLSELDEIINCAKDKYYHDVLLARDFWYNEHAKLAAENVRLKVELESRLAPDPRVAVWYPIGTAPKDGTKIIVWFRQYGAITVSWTDADGDPTSEYAHWHIDEHKHGPLPVRGYSEGDDTHWMPTPEAPQIIAAQRGEVEG